MTLPLELQNRMKSRIIDLVEMAGIDVSDWPNYKGGKTNPGANPKYCYEWALKQPGKVVVCNLWLANMQQVDGFIEQHLTLIDTPTRIETNSTRRARRTRMSELLMDAASEQLPVRVIILDGKTRTTSPDGKTHVKHRELDPETWSVTHADPSSGTYVLRRGALPEKFVDQFELNTPNDGQLTKTQTLVTTRSRSREVRQFALRRAGGFCAYCGSQGFRFPDGRVYLETHHVIPLSLGGLDSTSNVAALCANHHREAHHGSNADSIKLFLLQSLHGGDASSETPLK